MSKYQMHYFSVNNSKPQTLSTVMENYGLTEDVLNLLDKNEEMRVGNIIVKRLTDRQ